MLKIYFFVITLSTVHFILIYYFKVNGRDYQCNSKAGSSSYPNESKNIVYYDSTNPEKCKTEYEKSSGKVGGIICLIVTAIIIYFGLIKKNSNNEDHANQVQEFDIEKQQQIEENIQKAEVIIEKIGLIYKRVILGIIIFILLILTLFDTMLFRQTIVAKDYIETTATYVEKKPNEEESIFDDYIYTFIDRQEKQQEIIVSISKNQTPNNEIKIKYDENNPQEYYEEGSIMDKSGIIWYIVKIVALILLVILFFNKKLLSKIHIAAGKR